MERLSRKKIKANTTLIDNQTCMDGTRAVVMPIIMLAISIAKRIVIALCIEISQCLQMTLANR
jgi:hypothetical protein